MKKIQNYIAIFFLLIFFSQCTRGDKDCEGTQGSIDQEMIDYFGCFKEGSWWVYQDSISGEFDTLTVRRYEQSFGSNCYGCNNYSDYSANRYTWLNHTNSDYEYWYQLTASMSDSGLFNELIFHEGNKGAFNGIFTINYIQDKYYFYGNTDYGVFVDSVKIRNSIFKNVLEIDCEYTDYFFSPKIGLIKIVSSSTSSPRYRVMELIDYHINY